MSSLCEEVAVSARECSCGFRFPPPEKKISDSGDTESKILSEPETFEVVEAAFGKHRKKGDENAKPTLRIDYLCRKDEGILITKSANGFASSMMGLQRGKLLAGGKSTALHRYRRASMTRLSLQAGSGRGSSSDHGAEGR